MNRWMLATLVLRNRVRQEGLTEYLLRIGPLSILNVLLLAAMFTTAKGTSLDVGLLAAQYVYFVPLLALSAAVGTWEEELFAGLGERYLLRPSWLWRTRFVTATVECVVPAVFFVVLIALSSGADRWAQCQSTGAAVVQSGARRPTGARAPSAPSSTSPRTGERRRRGGDLTRRWYPRPAQGGPGVGRVRPYAARRSGPALRR
ncbi:hypothetical protein [Micromonospora sp. RTGN7]|uniref:hypothetical protein n=1 Tax=Micromonospora sp. RTGN7 TaxID=3016526 RepID=UPI0029FF0D27|nr:hypothetical protein [Micromonospora sp. RTGN7]